jgi:hypothetical protein
VSKSGASHRCNAIGDQTLYVGVLYAIDVNVGSRAHYIGAGGGTHCPLFESIAPDQGREVDLVPCGPSPLEINSNIWKVLSAPPYLEVREDGRVSV